MAECKTALGNLGEVCAPRLSEIKRFQITSLYKEDGTLNYITKADAAAIANWQTLYDKPSFSSTVLEKVIPTCLLYLVKFEQGDPREYDEGGYYEKLGDGDINITAAINGKDAPYIKSLKSYESNAIAVYMVDADNRVWGKQTSASDANLYPIPLTNIKVPDWAYKSFDTPNQVMITMRVKTPGDMNDLTSVLIADGDVTRSSDFYSLIDGTGTITAPAVTGCVAAIVDDKYNGVITGLADTGDYVYWNFYDTAAPTVAIPLAADGSITESPDGTYTINEALLLTSGQTYLLKVTHPRYDIDAMTVVVP